MQQQTGAWDVLIRNALLFDGSGEVPKQLDVALSGREIAALGRNLPPEQAHQVVDADGLWLMPGLLDIHTHLDLEVEVNPGLPEAVRHGSTTVIVGNCSLGTAFGPQARNGDNPIIDCFARVENMPKRVLQKCVDRMDWDNPTDYLAHFEKIPLGPNIAPLLPHSMLRIEAMGSVEASVTREPTAAELDRMADLLRQAMEQGFIGFSTDGIVFHYLANEPNKNTRIPTQFASQAELNRLTEIVRDHDRVWQLTPDSQKRFTTIRRFFMTSGRRRQRPLRMSALTALDFKPTPKIWKSLLGMAKLLNSPLVKGRFHLQALSTNFRMWADGAYVPQFEEFDSLRQWIACEIEDSEGRRKLLDDPAFVELFRKEWTMAQPITGWKAKLGLSVPKMTFVLDGREMIIDRCPISSWSGQTFDQVYRRLCQYQATGSGAENPEEAAFFERCPNPIEGEDLLFLQCLKEFDRQFRWYMDVANTRPEVLKQILFDENTLPGFNDSGAHISNLAFYDGNLLTLKMAAEESLEKVATAVRRLTREPAEFFRLDVGRIAPGMQADLVLIDPEQLKNYDTNANRQLVYNDIYENECLVNRSDGVVREVYIAGTRVWENGSQFTQALGQKTLGRALRAA